MNLTNFSNAITEFQSNLNSSTKVFTLDVYICSLNEGIATVILENFTKQMRSQGYEPVKSSGFDISCNDEDGRFRLKMQILAVKK